MIQNKFVDLKYPESVPLFLKSSNSIFKVFDNRHEENLNLKNEDQLLD